MVTPKQMKDIVTVELNNNFFSAVQTVCSGQNSTTLYYAGHTAESKTTPLSARTLFDLASLTKALFTVPAVYRLFEAKQLTPNTAVHDFFPSLHPRITVYSLLTHTAGLPAWKPFYKIVEPHDSYEQKKQKIIKNIALFTPDFSKRYSDLTFLLLGFLLETITEQPLNSLFEKLKQEICPSSNLTFAAQPLSKAKCVATSYSDVRKMVCHGVVEDENCYALGGVTGHAGLFGSAKDVADWISALLRTPWFTRWFAKTNGAGFDVPEGEHSSYGTHTPADAVGHLGFTGTAFLLSPKEQQIGVILTNRTHKNSEKHQWKQRIKSVRQAFFDNCFSKTTR